MPQKQGKQKNASFHQMAVSAYQNMVKLRTFEELVSRSYKEGRIGGFCHIYIGQEAIATGCNMALSPSDSVITAYRCHGLALIRGVTMRSLFAELFGKKTGSSKGKGGSMHLFNTENNFFGGHGIVGAQIPIGTGIALAEQYKQTNNVCTVFMGDGALNQGQVYESFNMAKLWNLPVIYVIENNQYAMGTSIIRGCANANQLYERGLGFGIKGIQIDGMDVKEVYETAKKAKKYAQENGPIIIEAVSYRYLGHSMSDPAKYRPKSEVEEIKQQHDPIVQLQQYIINNKIAKQNQLDSIHEEAMQQAKEARQIALTDPEPDLQQLYTDIY